MSKRLKIFLGLAIITFGAFSVGKIADTKAVAKTGEELRAEIENEKIESKKTYISFSDKNKDSEKVLTNIKDILRKENLKYTEVKNTSNSYEVEYEPIINRDGNQDEFEFDVKVETMTDSHFKEKYLRELSFSKNLEKVGNGIDLNDFEYIKNLIGAISNNEINIKGLNNKIKKGLESLANIKYIDLGWEIDIEFNENKLSVDIERVCDIKNNIEKKTADGVYTLEKVDSDSDINVYVSKLEIKDGKRIYDIVVENNSDDMVIQMGGEAGGYAQVNGMEITKAEIIGNVGIGSGNSGETGNIQIEVPNEIGKDIKSIMLMDILVGRKSGEYADIYIKNSEI